MSKQRPNAILLVMRLANMRRVHPKQIQAICSQCKEPVGIYPSGQQALARFPNIPIICFECRPQNAGCYIMAPGSGRKELSEATCQASPSTET